MPAGSACSAVCSLYFEMKIIWWAEEVRRHFTRCSARPPGTGGSRKREGGGFRPRARCARANHEPGVPSFGSRGCRVHGVGQMGRLGVDISEGNHHGMVPIFRVIRGSVENGVVSRAKHGGTRALEGVQNALRTNGRADERTDGRTRPRVGVSGGQNRSIPCGRGCEKSPKWRLGPGPKKHPKK